MSTDATSAYDLFPYHSKPIYPSHPDCLATVGILLGMRPTPLARCRVLEIGCAGGGHLIPLALQAPDSEFVGVDLSARQVAEGLETIEALGLTNIQLRAMNLEDIDESFGQFDYISCHGVYSWVPEPIQKSILAVCRDRLTPTGLVYISYNTYPGWAQQRVLRDLMVLHSRRFPDPETRLKQAKFILEFMINAEPEPGHPLAQHLKNEAVELLKQPDYYIYHEYLESDNTPVYFAEFMREAHAFGLQYLGESWTHFRMDSLKPDIRKTLLQISEDLIQLEQFHDFMRNRTFRRSVLSLAGVPLDRSPSSQVVMSLYVTALASPVSPVPDLFSHQPEVFEVEKGGRATIDRPFAKTLMVTLFEVWPRAIGFEELWERMRSRLGHDTALMPASDEESRELLAAQLLQAYMANFLALQSQPFHFTLKPGVRPVASPLARYQAAKGHSEVTTLRHRVTNVDDFDQIVLQLLDGTRDRDSILADLLELAHAGRLQVQRDGKPLTDRSELRPILEQALEPSLERLAGKTLLTA